MPTHSGIKDNGTHFQIVPNTRKVAVPQSHKTLGTVGDHLSEQVTFICPKLIDGHDIKGCSEHYISWETTSGEPGHDHLELIGEDAKNLLYAWNIRGNTTIEAGVVAFAVHFADVSETGKTLYHWGTTDCKECEILGTVNHAVGAYERIYVDGNRLVFADYHLVKDKKLLLQTPGVVPSGNKLIETNGHHDVAGLASVDVAVPTNRPPIIEVSESGLIKAHDGAGNETEQQLSVEDDPDFKPENIKKGVNIFGVEGTFEFSHSHVSITIEHITAYNMAVWYYTLEDGKVVKKGLQMKPGDTVQVNAMNDTHMTFMRYTNMHEPPSGTIYYNGNTEEDFYRYAWKNTVYEITTGKVCFIVRKDMEKIQTYGI